MTDKPSPDLTSLAREALDLWQDHLATLASDPKAKSELAQLMEPSRRLFAEWIEKAQNGTYANAAATTATHQPASHQPAPESRPAPAGPASDDGALRLAQLTLHVAELERRVTRLEARKPSSRKSASAKAARSADNDE